MDANDVAKLLLALVFVLDGLGYAERERFNARQARLRDRVQDPFRPIIRAIQGYLLAYHVYRAEALTDSDRAGNQAARHHEPRRAGGPPEGVSVRRDVQ